MMKYEIKTARKEENAAMQRVRGGLGHSRGRRRRSSSSFGGWWGRWESTGSLPQTDTTLSEERVCHEIVHVVVVVGNYAVMCCATMTTALRDMCAKCTWVYVHVYTDSDLWSWHRQNSGWMLGWQQSYCSWQRLGYCGRWLASWIDISTWMVTEGWLKWVNAYVQG